MYLVFSRHPDFSRIRNGRGQPKTGQAGGGGASRAQDAPGLALCYLISPQSLPGGCKTVTEKTSAAAAAADAGLVFYNYGGHRFSIR